MLGSCLDFDVCFDGRRHWENTCVQQTDGLYSTPLSDGFMIWDAVLVACVPLPFPWYSDRDCSPVDRNTVLEGTKVPFGSRVAVGLQSALEKALFDQGWALCKAVGVQGRCTGGGAGKQRNCVTPPSRSPQVTTRNSDQKDLLMPMFTVEILSKRSRQHSRGRCAFFCQELRGSQWNVTAMIS